MSRAMSSSNERRRNGPPVLGSERGREGMAASSSSSSEPAETLEYTPTWVVAAVCTVIVVISLLAERFLHYLGKFLKHNQQDALFEALQKLKEELMLLGFISLLLTVFQHTISHICIPASISMYMLPCKKEGFAPEHELHHGKALSHGLRRHSRRLLSESSDSEFCKRQGKVPLLSLEALHQLHIFIFVLAVVHVVFCATTMVLGGVKIRKWKHWEDKIRKENSKRERSSSHAHSHTKFIMERAVGVWTKSVVISWTMSFIKQFYASVTKADYRALRSGFIMRHCSSNTNFDFYKYMMLTLEDDFKIVVGISWYLWLFVIIFLLLNVNGWHSYFWLSFLPLILLLAVGTKLEHIITRLSQEAAEKPADEQEAPRVKPSDHLFWFHRPGIVLYLIHFILFQNSFEIAFFFWIWSTYGFDSCIMEKIGYIIPRLIIGVMVQVLCSYSTLPLYAIVTQMGDMFKKAIFDVHLRLTLHGWAEGARKRKRPGISSFLNKFSSKSKRQDKSGNEVQMQKMASEASAGFQNAQPGIVASPVEHSENTSSLEMTSIVEESL
ncbi:MLO-like protein 13 isoform X2 [Phoenix dactylifera]|uniref:MLO-like protein n=1 Tax=Phoenix dactylifera TaxID=42345 RepID=A0A8B8ZK18_PHODC|nr:MLO-like protein 13 isoform X2 [Phoenix dactylifera]